MKPKKLFYSIFLLICITSCQTEKVTINTLLNEMTDKTALTYFPENNYTLKQFSSYDRKSVSPDSAGWWANADYTQFIRIEKNEGRKEYVLFDAEGPGAVVRWWMTFAGEGASDGTIRIYFDGKDTPEIEANILEVLSGDFITTAPLASSVSLETEYKRRGHNLYLPFPYKIKCKITYECDAVTYEDKRWKPSIYYNINYRTYDETVDVESFTMQNLKAAKAKVENVNFILLNNNFNEGELQEQSMKIAKNEQNGIELKGEKAISKIRVKLNAKDINQALRSVVLSIKFDEESTVWVPVGDFFGTGYQIHPSETWFTKVDKNGWLEASWVMPFKNNAHVQLLNFDAQDVESSLQVYTKKYRWKSSSMYFGASWNELYQIHTASDPSIENHEWHYDVNFANITGQGLYVGDALTVFNTVDAWWGEGDEKIFVDGEDFPSSIGTGTEDYYGYAWCRPEKFSHPFIAQPTGAGNFHPGMTVNMRYRALDAIPFEKEISANIEMWHWVKTKINYASSSFWYAKPGFSVNVKPDSQKVTLPVALKRSDIYPPLVDSVGIIQGEYLEIMLVESGNASTQSGNFGWRNDSQLWWRNAKAGDELIAKFILNETGKYAISASLTRAIDYGMIQLSLNGVEAGKIFNGYYGEGVISVSHILDTHILSAGENILSLKIIGADKRSKPGNMAGIDFLKFEKLN